MRLAAFVISLSLALVPAILEGAQPSPKFAAAVDAERYPSARSPEQQPVFKWKFSERRDYRYKFEQTSSSRMSGFRSDAETATQSIASGDLVVRSTGDGSARLVLESIKMKMAIGSGDAAHDMTQDIPTIVLAGLREDGKVDSSAAAQQAFVRLLFPLPQHALAVGETEDLPIEVSFNAMGSPITVKGVTHLRNLGWVTLGKRICVEFRGETSFEELRVPEEIAGKYEFSMIGHSVFFFEPSEQRFVRGVIAIKTVIGADMPTPAITTDVEKDKAAPENTKMSIASDELITVVAE